MSANFINELKYSSRFSVDGEYMSANFINQLNILSFFLNQGIVEFSL